EGFQHLTAEVGMGRAGIVLGLEVSRLARNNADWHRLLEICALSSTLICDEDGLYNPAEFNDRLLLGLKGTMSEVLCRGPHKASYADHVVMPTRRRGHGLRLEGQLGFIGIIPVESWLALGLLPGGWGGGPFLRCFLFRGGGCIV